MNGGGHSIPSWIPLLESRGHFPGFLLGSRRQSKAVTVDCKTWRIEDTFILNKIFIRYYYLKCYLWRDMIIRELRVVSCELQVISCELSVVSCELVFSFILRVASCELRVVSCELRVGFPSYQFSLYFCSNFRF